MRLSWVSAVLVFGMTGCAAPATEGARDARSAKAVHATPHFPQAVMHVAKPQYFFRYTMHDEDAAAQTFVRSKVIRFPRAKPMNFSRVRFRKVPTIRKSRPSSRSPQGISS